MKKMAIRRVFFVLLCIITCTVTFGQGRKMISGTVTDTSGRALQGVSVTVKGTKSGTTSDASGKFSIGVPSSAKTLVFSLVGYSAREVSISESSTVTVALISAPAALEQVVVVAYGTQKKATLTGAVTQVKGDEIAKAPVANVVNSLQGKLPGLTFVQSGGQPGYDQASIDIRGFGSALVIVDGVESDFSQLDPNEIETISVLKDGAAAIYGFKASNGAIIVTTKRGKTGKAVISYNGYYGLQSITRYPKFLNAGQFTELTDESQINQGLPAVYGATEVQKWMTGSDSAHKSTDWFNTVLRTTAPMTSSNLNVSGGTDIIKYFFSGGLLDQQGLLNSKDISFKRYNFRSNISAKISKRITAEMNLGGRLEDRQDPEASFNSILGSVQRTFPTSAAYANNNPDYLASTNIGNSPLALSNSSVSGYDANQWRVFTGQANLVYDIPFVEGLNAKLLYSYESDNYNDKNWVTSYTLYQYNPSTQDYETGYNGNPQSMLKLSTFQGVATDVQFSLNYNHTFGSHHFTGLLLVERQKTNGTNFGAARNFSLTALDQLYVGDGTQSNSQDVSSDDGQFYQTAYQGYAGRIDYDYKGKYLLSAAGRYSWTWKNPNQPRFFPSISAGWNISKEPFFKVDAINNLKLRASWALIAEDALLNSFNYLSVYNYPSGSYVFSNGVITNGLSIGNYANPSLTFDKAHMYNLGIELGLLHNMLTVEADVFYRERTGLPANAAVTLPGTVGVSAPQININTDNTRGYELKLVFNKKVGDVLLNISPNIAYTRTRNGFVNQVPYTSARSNYLNNSANRWTNIIWGYKAVGQFQNQADINSWAVQDGQGNSTLKPGDIKYLDINKDGYLNSRDIVPIGKGVDGSGNAHPELSYGLNITAAYKGFDISAGFAGAAGFDIYYNNELIDPFFNNANSYAFFTNRWHHQDIYDPTSPWVAGKFPSTVTNGTNNNNGFLSDGSFHQSSFWLQNAAYLRLKTMQIGYTLPSNLTGRINIKQVRFFISGENLFTITGVNYLDPEASSTSRGAYYPQQRVITFGFNAQF